MLHHECTPEYPHPGEPSGITAKINLQVILKHSVLIATRLLKKAAGKKSPA